jgi:hypothetical protein
MLLDSEKELMPLTGGRHHSEEWRDLEMAATALNNRTRRSHQSRDRHTREGQNGGTSTKRVNRHKVTVADQGPFYSHGSPLQLLIQPQHVDSPLPRV